MQARREFFTGFADFDTDHVWGVYQETILDASNIARNIRFYEGGRTSVHCHDVAETIIVQSGSVRLFGGTDPDDLRQAVLTSGESAYIPAGLWHATACESTTSALEPYASVVEYVQGDHCNGCYEIRRATPALPSAALARAVAAGEFRSAAAVSQ